MKKRGFANTAGVVTGIVTARAANATQPRNHATDKPAEPPLPRTLTRRTRRSAKRSSPTMRAAALWSSQPAPAELPSACAASPPRLKPSTGTAR
eukprot:484659-Pleurochrysis_carterae.AAC.1